MVEVLAVLPRDAAADAAAAARTVCLVPLTAALYTTLNLPRPSSLHTLLQFTSSSGKLRMSRQRRSQQQRGGSSNNTHLPMSYLSSDPVLYLHH